MIGLCWAFSFVFWLIKLTLCFFTFYYKSRVFLQVSPKQNDKNEKSGQQNRNHKVNSFPAGGMRLGRGTRDKGGTISLINY